MLVAAAQTIADRVAENVDEALRGDVMHWAAFYEARMRIGAKKIFHLEAWVVKVMNIIKVRMAGLARNALTGGAALHVRNRHDRL